MTRINLFCSAEKKEEDAILFWKDKVGEYPIVVVRSPWDALRYLSEPIHHLYMEYNFPPDMKGDIYTCEAILHHLLNKENYPSGVITVAVRKGDCTELERQELKTLLQLFHNKGGVDTASEASGDTKAE